MLKKFITCLVVIFILAGNVMPVMAEETSILSTNIGELNASIAHGNGYLQGAATTSYTGSGCHAIYECTLQYLASTGVWATASDTHVVRVYEPGVVRLLSDNYYGLSVGTQYRYHVYARVINSDGVLVDADVANSSAITYSG